MRIRHLSVDSEWKNLKGLSLDLEGAEDITVVLGRNGAAKSNLLESIITIFRNIDLGDNAAFGYRLKYEIHEREVSIEAEAGKQPKARLQGTDIELTDLNENWAPHFIVGYYSGVSDRFEELFRKHDLRARNETLVPAQIEDKPHVLKLRRFILARPVHGLFALLAFYFSRDNEVDRFLKELPRIEGFDSVLLVVRKPTWAKKGTKPETFWGALGPVRELLDRFRKHSLAPFTRVVRVDVDFKSKQKRELMYLYLPDHKALSDLASEYGSDPNALFQALDTMRLSGLIEDFRVRVRVKGASGAIHTRQLSEGEQQLLTVLGLMRFTRNASSLYILDEPDTHLNPAWGLEYLDRLRKIGGIDKDSHTFMATHDPLVVAGLTKEEIRVLVRQESGGVESYMPDEDPKGRGIAAVLTSGLYGLESQLDLETQDLLQEKRELAAKDNLSDAQSSRLQDLNRLLIGVDYMDIVPDPIYREMMRAIYSEYQEQELNKPILTQDQVDERRRIARRLVASRRRES